MFELNKVGSYRKEELEAIIEGYKAAGVKTPEDGFANNMERAEFITLTAQEEGIPHEVTKEDIEANPDGGLEVGKTILLPIPDADEDARVVMMKQLHELLPDAEESYFVEAEKLSTEKLSELVNKTVADAKANKKGEETKEEPKAGLPEPSDLDDNVSEEEVAFAIDSGRVRYENYLIIGVRPVIANGRLRQELRSSEAMFSCSNDDFNTLIRAVLSTIPADEENKK